MNFTALVATEHDGAIDTALQQLTDADLMPGDVTVAVEYSSVNYKDAVALHGPYAVIGRFPMIPGIDFAGVVTMSADTRFPIGTRVVANSWGLGQTHYGGYAQFSRVAGDWLIALPASISTRAAMALGTAGYTAMLSLMSIEHAGITPSDGPVIVTGASGGVGSIAIMLLAARGFTVFASTGKTAEADYLKRLGANFVLDRREFSEPGKPRQDERWAAAVDSVGSHTLVNVIAQMQYGGHATCCGLAQGPDFSGTLFPFFQRGVTLAGIDSVRAPRPLRLRAWERLGNEVDQDRLELTISEIGLSDVSSAATALLCSEVRGRLVVDVDR